jgi:hypothetical protein
MDTKKRDFLAATVGIGAGLAAASSLTPLKAQERGPAIHANTQPATVDPAYKPRRINKAIELWEDGQPIYYNGAGMGPGVDPYAQGVKMARTWMDAINVEVEHNAGVHARIGGWRSHSQRPSHAGGVRGDLHHRLGRTLYAG